MDAKNLLLAGLLIVIAAMDRILIASGDRDRVVCHACWYSANARRHDRPLTPTPLALGIAFVANFFDTLGIGSYATTTSMSKLWNVMPRREDSRHAERRLRDGHGGAGA